MLITMLMLFVTFPHFPFTSLDSHGTERVPSVTSLYHVQFAAINPAQFFMWSVLYSKLFLFTHLYQTAKTGSRYEQET